MPTLSCVCASAHKRVVIRLTVDGSPYVVAALCGQRGRVPRRPLEHAACAVEPFAAAVGVAVLGDDGDVVAGPVDQIVTRVVRAGHCQEIGHGATCAHAGMGHQGRAPQDQGNEQVQ